MSKLAILLTTAATALTVPTRIQREYSPLSFYVAVQNSGIVKMAFDPRQDVNHSLSITETTSNAGEKPGWLKSHQNNLYSISRTHYPDNSSVSGGLFAFEEHQDAYPSLSPINNVSSNGKGGVYCDVHPNGTLLSAANIDGSSISIYGLTALGRIDNLIKKFDYNLTHAGPGANDSQTMSNPHQAIFDPTGQFMVVPDRGADHVYIYSVPDATTIDQIANITLPLGTGPRHATFREISSSMICMYLVSELDNTVRVFTIDYGNSTDKSLLSDGLGASDGPKIQLRQTISTLGMGTNRTAPNNHNQAAEIVFTNDGRFLYASNRNTISLKSDTVAIFSIDDHVFQTNDSNFDLAHLTYLGFNETLGKIPRNIALSNDLDNRWLAVANEVSQDIHVFERDIQSGFMRKQVGSISLGSGLDLTQALGPMCVLWA